MRHSGQALRYATTRSLVAFVITLTAFVGFAGTTSGQTVINTIQDLQNINNNLAGTYAVSAGAKIPH
jgi:hypothetical protein